MNIIHFIPVLIGQIQMCHTPNPLEWTIVIVTVGAILVGSGIAATGIVSIASTVITMLIAGASMEAISAAVAGTLQTFGVIGGSLELVAVLVNGVKTILGC
ncbi:MAG: hypothetical protein ICV78_21040 [Tolypothrix sp. Co-bin9]|jgi:hypothetical protein|nr:hypothetical protein [Tolypothrix sp. Co-bin9]